MRHGFVCAWAPGAAEVAVGDESPGENPAILYIDTTEEFNALTDSAAAMGARVGPSTNAT